jgi:hypothetical protein
MATSTSNGVVVGKVVQVAGPAVDRKWTEGKMQLMYKAITKPCEAMAPSAPTAALTVVPASISTGASATLTWSSTNATSCTGTGFTASGTSGSLSVSPTATTTYSIVCTGAGGTSPSESATLTVASSGGATTAVGATLPVGWTLKQSDRFGTAGNVTNFAQLHNLYYEAAYFNRDPATGLVNNYVCCIGGNMNLYGHFEDVIVFGTDHLTIQGRGHPDGSIWTGEMVSKLTSYSWAVEAKISVPKTDKTWGAFWFYGADSTNTDTEIDTEFTIDVGTAAGEWVAGMELHPTWTGLTKYDPKFNENYYMSYQDLTFLFDFSLPHTYTMVYDNSTGLITRWIDGVKIYSAHLSSDGTTPILWNYGAAGRAPMTTLVVLDVGGVSVGGNPPNPAAWVGDMNVWSIEYYGP